MADTYDHVTAFGTTHGNLTDDARLRAQQGQTQAAIDAQMRALQAEIADRQAGRAFQGDQANQDRSFQGGMFDKNAALQTGLDKSATERAFGTVDRQMGPANSDAAIRKAEWDAGANRRALQDSVFKQIMPAIAGGGQPGAPAGNKFSMDPDAMMFMAMGGNPGEYMMQKRTQGNADRQHQDAEDARNTEIGTKLIASGKPEAVALGTHFLSLVKNSGFAGQDPATLKTALQPERDANEVVAKSPSMMMKIDNAATLLNNASRIGGNEAQIEQAKPILISFIKDLTDQGVKPEEAQAYATAYLKKKLPANSTLTGDLINGLLTVGLGPVIKGPADDRTVIARQVAGLVD